MDDDAEDRHQRPTKYRWTEHAERNAIYNAARIGMGLKGCTMYVTHVPCADCARAIVQVGIREVVVDRACLVEQGFNDRWDEESQVTREMLKEAGVALRMAEATEDGEGS